MLVVSAGSGTVFCVDSVLLWLAFRCVPLPALLIFNGIHFSDHRRRVVALYGHGRFAVGISPQAWAVYIALFGVSVPQRTGAGDIRPTRVGPRE